ncbi:MAG: hypothetical protein CMD06_00510 [Flavobacteriales bacterium]|nr:hypothetical protein [Flavobacteriales bacterium]
MLTLKEIHNLCIKLNFSICVAESCTSGAVASILTSLSGSSKYFKGGVIAYNNDIKENILGVSKTNLIDNTEVSAQVIEEMAKNVRIKFNTDFSIATSGYLGPTGGSIYNPKGTIFISVSSRNDIVTNKFLFKGDRKVIKKQTVHKSLELLLTEIKKVNKL